MKKITLLVILAFIIGTSPALALPYLQLDISDGEYDTTTETVVAISPVFTLYALVDSESTMFAQGETYYISAAVAPQVSEEANLGSFDFNGTTVAVTDDMIYGTAPIDEVSKNLDLPNHGIFPTYFTEFSFTLDPVNRASAYNVQDTPGGFQADSEGSLYYAAFALDVSGLDPQYAIHFDLYTKNADGSINKFAPFSHDAQSAPVPEPATMLLLGTGLIGLAGIGRNKLKK